MQDNQLHANLTVEEAMAVATNLKLEKAISKSDKQDVVGITCCNFNRRFTPFGLENVTGKLF